MKGLARRRFVARLGASAAGLLVPPAVLGRARPRVVVVGGGAGGATAARYVADGSRGEIDVTLVDESDLYTSCFHSNLYLGGLRELDRLTHSYGRLVSKHGVRKVTGRAVGIDREARVVAMDDGTALGYDRLIVAPGIDLVFDSVPGYSEASAELAPHAWRGRAQTALLKRRLDALGDGARVVIVAPPNPYRCPPGPYERASLIARLFGTKGLANATVTILDAKSTFSKQALFFEAWERHYPGVVEWLPPEIHGGVLRVDAEAGLVETDIDAFEAELINVIPAQRAGAFARAAGLADDSGFCPVDGESMRSVRDSNAFVIGDACIAGAMPKSAFAANAQAKVAAMHARADLLGTRLFPARYANVCWSAVAAEEAVKVGATYAVEGGEIVSSASFVSDPGEGATVRSAAYAESVDWYRAIVRDMFG